MKSFVATIAKVIRDGGDNSVLKIVYVDEKGRKTRRYVSPYQFCAVNDEAFEAMSLSQGDDGGIRRFVVERCSEIAEFPANLVFLAPIDGGGMPLEVLEESSNG